MDWVESYRLKGGDYLCCDDGLQEDREAGLVMISQF